MNKDDNFGRLLVLLLITLTLCLGMYWLPNQLFGYKIKKVDLLADIRVKSHSLSLDSLRQQLASEEVMQNDVATAGDSILPTTNIDQETLSTRDSLYKAIYATQGADSMGMHIEDYSAGHVGLKRFFAALNSKQRTKRPVRIAFLGDSFIEGDIMVADFRSSMQNKFGGRGVGFVPISSVAAQFRPTIEQRSKGWTTWSMLTDHKHAYTLSGMMFEPGGEEASVSMKTTNRFPELETVSSVKFIYEQSKNTKISLVCNDEPDTLYEELPPTAIVTQYELEGDFNKADFKFTDATDLRALGVVMEDNTGVVVDNFSLRGNSGLILERLDIARCQALNKIRPYDLIVLQYGLNVVSEDVLQYNWYTQRMIRVVRHLQICFPQADILMLGVSDRSKQEDGEFETMPAVLALLHAQRQAAKQAGIPFWNVFGAMGGENSMVRYVEKNWASKDYTHLSFRGGKEIASFLFKAILSEKEFYDEAEKKVY